VGDTILTAVDDEENAEERTQGDKMNKWLLHVCSSNTGIVTNYQVEWQRDDMMVIVNKNCQLRLQQFMIDRKLKSINRPWKVEIDQVMLLILLFVVYFSI
jgi:hypothetical protein